MKKTILIAQAIVLYFKRMRMKLLCTIGFFVVAVMPFNTRGQEIIENRIDVHIMPFSLMDFTPRLRAGIDIKSEKRISYSVSLGYGNEIIGDAIHGDWNKGNKYKFYEVRPQVRYHLTPRNPESYYIGAEAFYLSHNDQYNNNYYRLENSSITVHFDKADYVKNKIGLNIVSGCQFHFDRFILEPYTGIGAGYRIIKYSNVDNPVEHTDIDFDNHDFGSRNVNGEEWKVQFPAGIKLGWKLN